LPVNPEKNEMKPSNNQKYISYECRQKVDEDGFNIDSGEIFLPMGKY